MINEIDYETENAKELECGFFDHLFDEVEEFAWRGIYDKEIPRFLEAFDFVTKASRVYENPVTLHKALENQVCEHLCDVTPTWNYSTNRTPEADWPKLIRDYQTEHYVELIKGAIGWAIAMFVEDETQEWSYLIPAFKEVFKDIL